MDVTLPQELERVLAEAVAEGRFANASEAVAEGLRLLFASKRTWQAVLESEIQAGLDDADRSDFFTGEEVQAEILARLASRRRA